MIPVTRFRPNPDQRAGAGRPARVDGFDPGKGVRSRCWCGMCRAKMRIHYWVSGGITGAGGGASRRTGHREDGDDAETLEIALIENMQRKT